MPENAFLFLQAARSLAEKIVILRDQNPTMFRAIFLRCEHVYSVQAQSGRHRSSYVHIHIRRYA